MISPPPLTLYTPSILSGPNKFDVFLQISLYLNWWVAFIMQKFLLHWFKVNLHDKKDFKPVKFQARFLEANRYGPREGERD